MINFKKYILRLLSFGFLFMFSASSVFADFRFAKIVVLGTIGSGKTSVVNVLTSKQNAPEAPNHSRNLDIKERIIEIDGSFVSEKLWDTSAENEHLALISDFCRNATVAIIIIDMESISEQQLSASDIERITDNWFDTLNDVSPNCKLVILGTKRDELDRHVIRLNQAKENIRRIANFEGIAEKTEGRVEFVSAQRDNPQQLYETMVNRIDEAIRSYGVQNLPTSPRNLLARIVRDVPKRRVVHNVRVPYAGRKHYTGNAPYSGNVTADGSVDNCHTVLVWPFRTTEKINFSKTVGYNGSVHYEGDVDYQGETDYTYETFEDNPDGITYRLEYYGDSF